MLISRPLVSALAFFYSTFDAAARAWAGGGRGRRRHDGALSVNSGVLGYQ